MTAAAVLAQVGAHQPLHDGRLGARAPAVVDRHRRRHRSSSSSSRSSGTAADASGQASSFNKAAFRQGGAGAPASPRRRCAPSRNTRRALGLSNPDFVFRNPQKLDAFFQDAYRQIDKVSDSETDAEERKAMLFSARERLTHARAQGGAVRSTPPARPRRAPHLHRPRRGVLPLGHPRRRAVAASRSSRSPTPTARPSASGAGPSSPAFSTPRATRATSSPRASSAGRRSAARTRWCSRTARRCGPCPPGATRAAR